MGEVEQTPTPGAPPVDPSLVQGWLAARSLARGLPAPVVVDGGWRVDTAGPTETARYVFASANDGLRRLAAFIAAPRILLKLCGTEAAMLTAVPPRWRTSGDGWFMTLQRDARDPSPVPPGYDLELGADGEVVRARIFTRAGVLAASGHAAGFEGVFVYDRIVTEEAHRRRGLGSAVMAALASRRRASDARQLLVATHEGRALYTALGWAVLSPWTTALIPAD